MTTNIIKDGLPLSPSRDLGHLFIPALRESFRLLDQVAWSDSVAALAECHDMTEQDLVTSVETFMAAVQQFTGNPEVTTIDEAFAASGFTATADFPRLVLFATLGEVLTAGFFIAVREMTFSGSIPPTSGSMVGMLAAGSELCRRLHRIDSVPPDCESAAMIEAVAGTELVAAKLRLDGLLGQLYNQRLDRKSISDDLATVTAQMNTYRDAATTLAADVADLKIQLGACETREQALQRLLDAEQRDRTLDAGIARGEIQELKQPLWRKFLTGVMRLIGR